VVGVSLRWGSRDVGPEEWQRLMAEIRARHGKLANFLSKHSSVFELRSRPGGKEIRLVPRTEVTRGLAGAAAGAPGAAGGSSQASIGSLGVAYGAHGTCGSMAAQAMSQPMASSMAATPGAASAVGTVGYMPPPHAQQHAQVGSVAASAAGLHMWSQAQPMPGAGALEGPPELAGIELGGKGAGADSAGMMGGGGGGGCTEASIGANLDVLRLIFCDNCCKFGSVSPQTAKAQTSLSWPTIPFFTPSSTRGLPSSPELLAPLLASTVSSDLPEKCILACVHMIEQCAIAVY
jgi:hypothetical protein